MRKEINRELLRAKQQHHFAVREQKSWELGEIRERRISFGF